MELKAVLESRVSTSLVSAVASSDANKFLVYNNLLNSYVTYLFLNHCVTNSPQTFFRRLLCFAARACLLFVDARLEAFVDEREVRSRRESIRRSK